MTINCNGDSSYIATINCPSASDVTFTVYCNGDSSCCDANILCGSGDCYVSCGGYDSGTGLEI